MDEIGVGDSALLCRTNNTGCCGSSFTSFRGEFYYPGGSIVPTAGSSPSFYRNRDTGFIRLNRQPNTDIPLGEYRCEIPDDRGIRQNLFINIGKSDSYISVLSYTTGVPTPFFPPSSKCHFSVLSNNCTTSTANHMPTHIIPSNLSSM